MRFLFALFLLVAVNGFAQTFSATNFGGALGLVLNVGTHSNSIGLMAKAYYTDYFYQFNMGTTVTWNLNAYGERKKFIESRNYIGLLLLGGKRNQTVDFQLDGLMHQTTFQNAIGYNYLWYFDNIGTSQRSGGWSLHLNKFSVLFENDVFGGQAKDRFRTGHVLVSYRYQQFKFGTGVNLWTGETDGAAWEKVSIKECPYGYKCLDELPFGKTSHGILYGTVLSSLPYGQTAQLKIGIDSENIRNAVQNRLIHDLIFLPKNIARKTPHYPKLDQDGCPVFNNENLRSDKFYLQLGANTSWSE